MTNDEAMRELRRRTDEALSGLEQRIPARGAVFREIRLTLAAQEPLGVGPAAARLFAAVSNWCEIGATATACDAIENRIIVRSLVRLLRVITPLIPRQPLRALAYEAIHSWDHTNLVTMQIADAAKTPNFRAAVDIGNCLWAYSVATPSTAKRAVEAHIKRVSVSERVGSACVEIALGRFDANLRAEIEKLDSGMRRLDVRADEESKSGKMVRALVYSWAFSRLACFPEPERNAAALQPLEVRIDSGGLDRVRAREQLQEIIGMIEVERVLDAGRDRLRVGVWDKNTGHMGGEQTIKRSIARLSEAANLEDLRQTIAATMPDPSCLARDLHPIYRAAFAGTDRGAAAEKIWRDTPHWQEIYAKHENEAIKSVSGPQIDTRAAAEELVTSWAGLTNKVACGADFAPPFSEDETISCVFTFDPPSEAEMEKIKKMFNGPHRGRIVNGAPQQLNILSSAEEIKRLREALAAANDTIRLLSDDARNAERENQALREQLEVTKNRLAKRVDLHDADGKALFAATDRIRALEARLGRVEQRLVNVRNDRNTMIDANRKLEQDLATEKGALATAKNRITELETQNRGLRRDLASVASDRDDAQRNYEGALASVNGYQDKAARQAQRADALARENTELQRYHNRLREHLKEVMGVHHDLMEAVEFFWDRPTTMNVIQARQISISFPEPGFQALLDDPARPGSGAVFTDTFLREHLGLDTDERTGEWETVGTMDIDELREALNEAYNRGRASVEQPKNDGLTFAQLARANDARSKALFPADDWSLTDWATAALGELGEAANVIKKIRRGDFALQDARKSLAKELADTVAYLDLLAERANIDLGQAVAEKWDEISRRRGYPKMIADFAEGRL